MESHSISHQGKGFTLIETVITIAMLAIIFSFGLWISFDFYKSHSFRSEKNTIISALQKARGQSQNNINQTRHGVYFQAEPTKYIIFECPGVNPNCSNYTAQTSDIIINASYEISFSPPSPPPPFTIIFEQLSGDCVNCQEPETIITVNDGPRSYTISINSEGRISW